jgi:8-oxo-dGTP pyrophosphatase MutT (NUDIX family)
MKVLFETPFFDFVNTGDKHGLLIKRNSVAVLPYTVDANGIVEKIGILHEWNTLREGNYANTLITGSIDDSDEDAYATAVRELFEEGGFDMRGESSDKWVFLGTFHDSKDSNREIPTFAVDVTGVEQGSPSTDGSSQESKSTLKMTDVNEAVLTNELLVLGSFLRLFNIMYRKSFKNAK